MSENWHYFWLLNHTLLLINPKGEVKQIYSPVSCDLFILEIEQITRNLTDEKIIKDIEKEVIKRWFETY